MILNFPQRPTVSVRALGLVPMTRETVRTRARELALLAGRAPACVTQIDYEQAKREVTGESDFERQEALLECAPAFAAAL
jgi:hypothetical protein